MQLDSMPHRNEGRFAVEGLATRVTVTALDGPQEGLGLPGQLADMSLHGVKVEIHGRLAVGTRVRICIEIPSVETVIEREAVVRRHHPRDAMAWWIGCQLDEPFKQELIDFLATAGVVNRRRDSRLQIGKLARARWELSDEVVDVELRNLSRGGFCLVFARKPAVVRERLLLLLRLDTEEVTVAARVMWGRPMGDQFAVGCAFGTHEGFVQTRDFSEIRSSRMGTHWIDSGQKRVPSRPYLWNWLPLIAFLLVGAGLLGSWAYRRGLQTTGPTATQTGAMPVGPAVARPLETAPVPATGDPLREQLRSHSQPASTPQPQPSEDAGI